MSRKLVLVSETISNLLIKQLAHELKNYNLYKSFANYYDVEGCIALAEYYKKRPCVELVGMAASIMEKYIEEKAEIKM